MKELTIEEKAKIYNEVREKIALRFGSNVAEEIFSEFEMSEDERIRGAIIHFISHTPTVPKGIIGKEIMIAWLEKQKEPELSEDLSDYIAELNKQFPEVSFAKLSRIAVRVKNWLKKQSEQKPTDKVEPKFQNGQWIVWQNKCYKVYYNGCGYELIDQNGLSTSLEYGTVDTSARLWDITKDARDGDVLAGSKNDVVLMFRGIGNTEWYDVIDYHCYYDYYREDFIVQEDVEYWGNTKNNQLKPATKEQRDTLERAITNAGYRWDKEKLKLKKISQRMVSAEAKEALYDKPAWSEEDMKEALRTEYEKGSADAIAEIGGNFIEDDSEEFDIAIETLKEAGQFSSAKWLESIKDRILPKHEWRDEDENGLGDALWAIKQARTIAKDENDMGNLWYAENWLNSIKNRIQPQIQSKQEWTEEDISNIQYIDSVLFYDKDLPEETCMRLRNWLQSLKPNKDMVEALRTEYEKGRADTIAEMKSSWGEEDEVKINRIVACLENLNVADNDILLKDVDWLKSFKDRVFPQPKPIWSEEDEARLMKVIWYVDNPAPLVLKDTMLVEWLKQLKQRIGG